MKKLKSNDDTSDRLIALPDSLILEVLSLLDMRDVVRTSLLAKRWKYLWTTTPCLQFYEYKSDVVELRNFVNRTLMLWRGTHLRKFEICNGGNDGLDYDANLWILFAKERKVEELDIYSYSPSQSIYECSSLRKLKITYGFLETVGNVQWDRLNSLKLYYCDFSEHWLNQVLSSSPQLETFSYRYDVDYNCECKNLCIRSSSLKRLSIESTHDDAFVTIWAPNLEALEISGEACSEYLLTNIASLTKVYIGLSSNNDSPAILEEALSQILLAIQHVETVTLSAGCFKMLGVMKAKYSVSPLSNVKLLKIERGVTGLTDLHLLCLLEFFPKLEMLIIDWEYGEKQLKFNASDANILQSNLLLLRTVKIYLFWYNALIFEFIEFLLKHGVMIEKIVIQVRRRARTDNSEDLILAAQKVVSLQRSFPSVELIIC